MSCRYLFANPSQGLLSNNLTNKDNMVFLLVIVLILTFMALGGPYNDGGAA